MPPLRERRGDLPLLVQYFLKKFTRPGANPERLTGGLEGAVAVPFPGNVRELGHAIEHAAVLADGGEIDVRHLPAGHRPGRRDRRGETAPPRPLGTALRSSSASTCSARWPRPTANARVAAEILGISRKNLWEKLRMHGFND